MQIEQNVSTRASQQSHAPKTDECITQRDTGWPPGLSDVWGHYQSPLHPREQRCHQHFVTESVSCNWLHHSAHISNPRCFHVIFQRDSKPSCDAYQLFLHRESCYDGRDERGAVLVINGNVNEVDWEVEAEWTKASLMSSLKASSYLLNESVRRRQWVAYLLHRNWNVWRQTSSHKAKRSPDVGDPDCRAEQRSKFIPHFIWKVWARVNVVQRWTKAVCFIC